MTPTPPRRVREFRVDAQGGRPVVRVRPVPVAAAAPTPSSPLARLALLLRRGRRRQAATLPPAEPPSRRWRCQVRRGGRGRAMGNPPSPVLPAFVPAA